MNQREAESHENVNFIVWWVGGWTAPLLITIFTVAWALLIFFLIGDRPTTWNYGVVPFVPSQSIITTRNQTQGKVPDQIVFPKSKGNR